MSKTFKDRWSRLSKSEDKEPVEITATTPYAFPKEKAMTNGEDEPTFDTTVEKPGASIHSAKWDDCIRDVQSKGNAGNAYAVCTAKLGEEAFKSEVKHLAYVKSEIKKAQREVEETAKASKEEINRKLTEINRQILAEGKKGDTATLRALQAKEEELENELDDISKMGTEAAGPVPESLLADQDLEGKKKSEADEISDEDLEAAAEFYDRNAKKNQEDMSEEADESEVALADGEGYTKSEGEDDGDVKNPEQAWTSLKRMRKDLESAIGGLTQKMTKAEEEKGGYSNKLKDANKRLADVNKRINKLLEYMKTNG